MKCLKGQLELFPDDEAATTSMMTVVGATPAEAAILREFELEKHLTTVVNSEDRQALYRRLADEERRAAVESRRPIC